MKLEAIIPRKKEGDQLEEKEWREDRISGGEVTMIKVHHIPDIVIVKTIG